MCCDHGLFPDNTLAWTEGEAGWKPMKDTFASPRSISPLPASSAPVQPVAADGGLREKPAASSFPVPQAGMPVVRVSSAVKPPPADKEAPTPVPPPPPLPQEEATCYIARPGEPHQGPYTRSAVLDGYRQGVYPAGTMVWSPGSGGWMPVICLQPPGSAPGSGANMPEPPRLYRPREKGWNVITAFSSCMKRYAQFRGRASRSEFWFFQFGLLLLSILVDLVAGSLTPEAGVLLDLGFRLAIILPMIAVAVRRCHDTGRSGWCVLVPIYNCVICFLSSRNENNRYGDVSLPPV